MKSDGSFRITSNVLLVLFCLHQEGTTQENPGRLTVSEMSARTGLNIGTVRNVVTRLERTSSWICRSGYVMRGRRWTPAYILSRSKIETIESWLQEHREMRFQRLKYRLFSETGMTPNEADEFVFALTYGPEDEPSDPMQLIFEPPMQDALVQLMHEGNFPEKRGAALRLLLNRHSNSENK